jgi:hypothetical protein
MPIAPSAISTQPHHGTLLSDPFAGVVDVGDTATLFDWMVWVVLPGTVSVEVFAGAVSVLVFVSVVVRAGSVTVVVLGVSVVVVLPVPVLVLSAIVALSRVVCSWVAAPVRLVAVF